MQHIYYIIIGLVAIGVGGALLLQNTQAPIGDAMHDDAMQEDVMMNDAGGVMTGDAMMQDESAGDAMMHDDAMMSAGSYEAYAPEKLAKAADGKVVLFFRASWCPTCKALDADIRSHLKEIPEGVTILDVDYDNSAELKKKYGVTYQHTLVQVDADGKQLAKWAGSPNLAEFVTHII